ncbi:MAG: hypothetical protein QOI41_5967 [Myxococcales bacterium]|nr:hypothetical protein [Myxococcales bacterium]
MVTDPYEDDDDSPTLQRPAPASTKVARLPGIEIFLEESSTDTDLAPLDPLADAHTVDALPPDAAIALMDAPDYSDMETPKIPLDVAAVLARASLEDDGSGS